MMQRLTKPPRETHGLSPEEVIGSADDYRLLARHYGVAAGTNSDNFDRTMKRSFTDRERDRCAMLYQKIFDNGFLITGVAEWDDSGRAIRLRFGIITKSDVHQLLEKYLPSLPDWPSKKQVEQMKAICRQKFAGIVKGNEETIAAVQETWLPGDDQGQGRVLSAA